jgi:hypothetical protein
LPSWDALKDAEIIPRWGQGIVHPKGCIKFAVQAICKVGSSQ